MEKEFAEYLFNFYWIYFRQEKAICNQSLNTGPENSKKKKSISDSSESEKEKKHKKHKKSEKKHKKNKKRKHKRSKSKDSASDSDEVKEIKTKKLKKNIEEEEWVELTKELREEQAQRHKEEEALQIGPQIPDYLLQKNSVTFYDDDNIRGM